MPKWSDSKTLLQPLLSCFSDLKTWMKLNILNFNENEKDRGYCIWLGKPDVLGGSADTLGFFGRLMVS